MSNGLKTTTAQEAAEAANALHSEEKSSPHGRELKSTTAGRGVVGEATEGLIKGICSEEPLRGKEGLEKRGGRGPATGGPSTRAADISRRKSNVVKTHGGKGGKAKPKGTERDNVAHVLEDLCSGVKVKGEELRENLRNIGVRREREEGESENPRRAVREAEDHPPQRVQRVRVGKDKDRGGWAGSSRNELGGVSTGPSSKGHMHWRRGDSQGHKGIKNLTSPHGRTIGEVLKEAAEE